jgi:PAS domain S-box-containing protein
VDEFFAHVYPDPKERKERQTQILADIGSGEANRMAWSDIEITTSSGEKRYVDARNIPLIDQDLMVSTVIDVTERKKKTDERKIHLDEIERMNKLMVGRELKMGEMKKVLEQSLKKETLVKQADKFEVKAVTVQDVVPTKMDIKASVLLNTLQRVAIVSITDARGTITYVNDKFVEISQFSRSELIGKNHRLVKSGYHDEEFYKNMWQAITSGKIWHGEIKNKAKDGSYYWVDASICPNFDDTGKIVGYIAIRFPITKIKSTEEELKMRNRDLEKINQLAVGRELKMVELKKAIDLLKNKPAAA